jgi:hypothetical protein
MHSLQSIIRFCCYPPAIEPKKLRRTLHRYRATYTTYLTCVHALSDACENGLRPQPELMAEEQASFEELKSARKALLATVAQNGNGPAAQSASTSC